MAESYFNNESRVDKFDKRRKNTKLINTLIVFAVILGVFFIALFLFDDEDEEASNNTNDTEETSDSSLEEELDESDDTDTNPNPSEEANADAPIDPEENNQPEDNLSDENNEEANSNEVIEESDDPNVLETIVKDWQPIGTTQAEPHVATYDETSQDWKEMWEAARYATGLSEDDYIEWRAENNGNEHKAKITISNKAQTETYRVYVEWVTNKGWKPTRVEVLKENDIKEKYYSNNVESNADEQTSEEDVQLEGEE